jgi:hypothetical protein
MATETTTIFQGSLDPVNGTTTDKFNNADYAIIIAPLIEANGDEFEVDTFLQLEFGNRNRLISLSPVNMLDTNKITILPIPFKAGNEFDLYLWILASQPFIAEVIIASNVDDNIVNIKENIEEIKESLGESQEEDTEDVLRTVIDVLRLSGGDTSALINLFGDVVTSLDSLEGVELPALPEGADSIRDITQFYGL